MKGIETTWAWLKKRRDANRHPPAPHYWQIFAIVAANLVLLSFLVFDTAVGAVRPAGPFTHSLGELITDFGSSGWILIASAILFFEGLSSFRLSRSVKRGFRALYAAQIGAYFFLAVALSGLSANLLKRIIGRARPSQFDEWGSFGFSSFSGSKFESFPSGHATTVGAIFMVLILLVPRYRLAFILLALWMGFSRVMVSAHYPSDVIAGLSYGGWFSLLLANVFARYRLVFMPDAKGWPVPRLSLIPVHRLPPDLLGKPFGNGN
ncbi:lipid A 1-phosphatase LpxE [Rhizobium cremeum]|uniref:lipid A 1-phosphatase LpxE n=1 Tax=Rhizobium cremeum TaxID=2813827 RepID=UPI0039DFF669